MASAFSHVVCAVALGSTLHPRVASLRFWLLGAACAVAPDLDVIGHRLGVPYESPFGHRGASHSLVFAAALAAGVAGFAFARPGAPQIGFARAWTFLFLATASHGLLDAMTNGGLGIAFLWPFDDTRHFLPFRPLEVSPLRVRKFFSARGLEILGSELVWVWLPAAALAAAALAWRRRPVR